LELVSEVANLVNTFEVAKGADFEIRLDEGLSRNKPVLSERVVGGNNGCTVKIKQNYYGNVVSRYFQYRPYESLWGGVADFFNSDNNSDDGIDRGGAVIGRIDENLSNYRNYLVYRLSRIPYQKVETCSYDGNKEKIIESGFYYLVDQAGVVRIKTMAPELPEYDLNLLSSVSRVEDKYKLQVSTNRFDSGDKLIVKIDNGSAIDLTKVSTPNDYWLFEKELNLRSQNTKLYVSQESNTGKLLADETFYVRLLASDDPGGGSLQDLGNSGSGNEGGSASNDSGSPTNSTTLDLVVTSAITANTITYNLTGTSKNANKIYYRDQLHQTSTKLPIDVFNISGRGQTFTKGIKLPYLGENILYITVENSSGQAKSVTHRVTVNSGVTTPDRDGDRIIDDRDLCPSVPATNGRHADRNNDGVGDDCANPETPTTPDTPSTPETPPTPQNPDSDGDGVVNERDNCPAVYNLGQTNSDNDALGDACDQDDDNDTVLDALDNCPTVANTDQADSDRDLVGNVCEGLVAETVNPIDLTFVPATPNIFKVDTKAPSNRVVVNLYNATTDSPIYTVDFYLSEGTTATTLLAVGQYNCVLLLGCNGFNGEVQNFTLPLNVPLYYKASIKLADGFTYSDRSENFVFTTLPTTPGQGVGGQEFADVNQFDPNYVAVKYVAELGLMRGSNGLFRPYDQLTRAESFAISNRLSGANRGCQAYNPQFDGNLGFVDLFASINAPETYWYMTEIKCSRALGIVRGYADGTVKPLNAVNEAESVKVLLSAAAAGRALRATLPLVQGLENPWWLPYYEFLNRNGLNFPVNNGGQIITRGQFAQLVYALGNRGLIDANVIRSNLGLPPLSTTGTAGSSTTSGSGFNNSIVLPPAN
jgi:hypothetical protein